MIDYTRLRPDAVHTEPFTWAWFTGCLDPAHGRELVDRFPSDELVLRVSGTASAKEYSVRSLTVHENGVRTAAGLPEVWECLADQVASAEFAALVGAVSGVEVRCDASEVRLTEYGHGFAMSPHTDRDDKLVTLIFYLGTDWHPGNGGELVVLGSPDADDEHARIPPTLGTCAMIVRSPSSWHRVAAPTRTQARRQGLLVHFTR